MARQGQLAGAQQPGIYRNCRGWPQNKSHTASYSITTSARIGSAKRHSTKSIQNCKLKTLKNILYFEWSPLWHSIWYSFWHSIWHSFWHSIWHSFWQSIWHLIQTYFLAFHYIVNFFLTFYLASILTFGLAFFLHLDPSVPHSIWSWRYGVQCSLHSAEKRREWWERVKQGSKEARRQGVAPLLKSRDPHWQVGKNTQQERNSMIHPLRLFECSRCFISPGKAESDTKRQNHSRHF